MRTVGSSRKDDGNGTDDARKQWSDWLNEEKQSCCTCGTHLSRIFWRSLPNDNVKFPNLRFKRQSEHTSVNLSFSIFTSTSPFAAYSINNHKIVTISQMFSFQMTFSLPLPSLLLKLPIEKSRSALGKTFQDTVDNQQTQAPSTRIAFESNATVQMSPHSL